MPHHPPPMTIGTAARSNRSVWVQTLPGSAPLPVAQARRTGSKVETHGKKTPWRSLQAIRMPIKLPARKHARQRPIPSMDRQSAPPRRLPAGHLEVIRAGKCSQVRHGPGRSPLTAEGRESDRFSTCRCRRLLHKRDLASFDRPLVPPALALTRSPRAMLIRLLSPPRLAGIVREIGCCRTLCASAVLKSVRRPRHPSSWVYRARVICRIWRAKECRLDPYRGNICDLLRTDAAER